MNESQDLSQIRHVEQADPVAAQVTSQPTRALELRLNNLYQLVQQLQSASAIGQFIIYNVNIQTVGAAAVGLNNFVFFNANTGMFEPALAQVTAVTSGFQSNPTAFFLGMVVAVRGPKADVMVGGYGTWVDTNQQQNMLEGAETYLPGIPYFLSALEAGKITRYAPTLRIQVLLGTDVNYLLSPSWSTPEAIENIYAVMVGMRPVGSLRALAPGYDHNIIVGFDALEKYNDAQQAWRNTSQSTVAALNQFGYLIADASVTAAPVAPVYIGLEIGTNGAISVYSAGTLADLYSGSPQAYNASAPLALADGNQDTVRGYAVYDTSNNPVGTLSFRFVSSDRTFARKVVLKFPDDFQGWKMVHAPVTPLASATISGGHITGITLLEKSVGYDTPPVVVITDGTGSGATAVAVLDDWGSIAYVTVTAPGSGYSAPTILFDSQVSALEVTNGGSGATATASLSGGGLDTLTLTNGGSGYLSDPDVLVIDTTGSGADAVVLAIARNDQVVELKIANPGHDYTNPILIIIPKRNQSYQKTVTGQFTPTVVGGAITSVAVVDGGFNYAAGAKVRFSGPGTGAVAMIAVDANGTITGIAMDAAGADYDGTTTVTVDQKDPTVLLSGGVPDDPATGHVTLSSLGVERVEILSEGIAYAALMTITPSGGLGGGGVAAQFRPILDGEGRISSVEVLSPGSGYRSVPDLTLAAIGDGNGAVLRVVLGAQVIAATVAEAGSNYQSPPTARVGVSLESVQVESGGTEYVSAPDVSIDPPDDPDGSQATAVAVLGAGISSVRINAGGTGYTDPANVTISVTGGGGTGAVLQPIIKDGAVVDVVVLDPGNGYTSAPTLTVNAVDGSDADIAANIEGLGAVIKINLTCTGSGYTHPPIVTVVPSSGVGARAHANLLGGNAQLVVVMAGSGGVRKTQAGVMADGNALQISGFHDDLDDGSVIFPEPLNTAFYYNLKADPALLLRYPAVPIEKAALLLNGVELVTSPLNESLLTARDTAADIILSRKTIFWPGMDADGSPWDREFVNYIQDRAAAGRDNVIQNTGLANDEDNWWRLWANTFLYESARNRAWMHINKASRFAASGKVVSIAAVSPLQLVDAASGIEAKSDGSPMSGQVLLTIKNQVNILSDPSPQIDLTTLGNLTAIYTNNTGRLVLVSSILLNVTFQLNTSGQAPTADFCASITVGTQEGNYADLIAEGEPVRLFALNQAKELFPDADNAAPLLAPNQKLYLRVVAPAGAPIIKQLAVARVKGHVL